MVEYADFYVLLATLSPVLMVAVFYSTSRLNMEVTDEDLDGEVGLARDVTELLWILVESLLAVGAPLFIMWNCMWTLGGMTEPTGWMRIVLVCLFGGQLGMAVRGMLQQARDEAGKRRLKPGRVVAEPSPTAAASAPRPRLVVPSAVPKGAGSRMSHQHNIDPFRGSESRPRVAGIRRRRRLSAARRHAAPPVMPSLSRSHGSRLSA